MVLWNFGALPSEDWARIRKLQLANKIRLQGTSAKSQVEAITVTSCLPHFRWAKFCTTCLNLHNLVIAELNLSLSMTYIFVSNHTLEPKNKGIKGAFVVSTVVSEMQVGFLKNSTFWILRCRAKYPVWDNRCLEKGMKSTTYDDTKSFIENMLLVDVGKYYHWHYCWYWWL